MTEITPPPLTLVESLQLEIATLREKLAWYEEQFRLSKLKQFGPSSERFEAQGMLFNEAEQLVEGEEEPAPEPETQTVEAHTRKKPVRKPLPDGERNCDKCNEPLKTFGHESSCKLDIIPASVKVIEYRRLKYTCACEECVKTAPLPKSPIPKSIATPGLLAWIIVSRYCDTLPLYRQEGILKRMAIDISRATMAGMHHFRFCHDFISFFNSRQTVVSEYSTICFGLHQKRMSLK